MAWQQLPGVGLWTPTYPFVGAWPTFATTASLAAATDKVAMCGRVFYQGDRSTSRAIRRVGFLFGTVSKANGSALTVSLQDVSLTAGPPIQPDGTQDQTVAIANADAGFVTGAWYRTGTLSADRTVTFGSLLSVVVEYSSFVAGDSVIITQFGATTISSTPTNVSRFSGAAWTALSVTPCVVLEFDDGTFGTLDGAYPFSAIGSLTYKQDTAGADEYCLEFQFPVKTKIDACYAPLQPGASTTDFNVVLYDADGTTPLATVTCDGNTARFAGQVNLFYLPFVGEIELQANTLYRLSVQPTQTTSSIVLRYIDVADAGHWNCHAGGPNWRLNSRLNLGAWIGAVTTRRPLMGVRVSSLDSGGIFCTFE